MNDGHSVIMLDVRELSWKMYWLVGSAYVW